MESRQPFRLLCYMFLWAWWCTTFNSIPIILIILTNTYNYGSIYSNTSLCFLTPYRGHTWLHSYTDGWNVMFFFTGSLLSTFNTQEGCNATLLCNQSGNVTWLNSTGQKIEGKHKTKQNIALLQRGIEPRYSQTSLLRRALKVFVLTRVKFIESKKLTF